MVAAQGGAAAEGGRAGEDHTAGGEAAWEAVKVTKSGRRCRTLEPACNDDFLHDWRGSGFAGRPRSQECVHDRWEKAEKIERRQLPGNRRRVGWQPPGHG